MNDDDGFGGFAGFVIGILVGLWIAGMLVRDYVHNEQWKEAEARCQPYGGVQRVEAKLDQSPVHYICRDGSEGEAALSEARQ